MHASQLIGLLKVLDKQELKELAKYIKSDYHNTKQANNVTKFFFYLIKYHPDYPESDLNRAKAHFYLFKKKETSNLRLNKITHLLKYLIEEFLVLQEQERQPYLKEKLLVKSLKRRHHPTFQKRNELLIKSIIKNRQQLMNIEDHFHLFELNSGQWFDVNTEKISLQKTSFQEANKQLDLFYFLHKLKIILDYETSSNIILKDFAIEEQTSILEIIKRYSTSKENITIKLLLQAIQMIHSSDEKDYTHLKGLFFKSIDKLAKKEARDIWVSLTNFYIKHANKNSLFPKTEGFELYRFGDKYDLLVEHNRIRDIEYTNAALLGFFTKNIDWTLIFIEKYKPFLSSEKRDLVYTYVKAFYFFQQKAFGIVTDLLFPIEQAEKKTLNIHVRIRSLSIRSHFELWEQNDYTDKDIKFLDTQFYNFERYIERNIVLAPNKKTDYLNFTKVLRKALKIKEQQSLQVSKLKKIKLEIDTKASISHGEWLLTKIDKLIESLSQTS